MTLSHNILLKIIIRGKILITQSYAVNHKYKFDKIYKRKVFYIFIKLSWEYRAIFLLSLIIMQT
jgi:hypothetical protein